MKKIFSLALLAFMMMADPSQCTDQVWSERWCQCDKYVIQQ